MSSFDNTYDNYDMIKESRIKCVRGVRTATGRTIHLRQYFRDFPENMCYTDDSRNQIKNTKRCDVCMSRFCMDCVPRKNLRTKAVRMIYDDIKYQN